MAPEDPQWIDRPEAMEPHGSIEESALSRKGFGRASLTLLIATFISAAVGLLTAPLQARALGPVGRGQLATAIFPITMISYVLLLGLQTYISRETAIRKSANEIFPTVALICIGVGLAFMPFGVWLASYLARGNGEVDLLINIQVFLMPIILVGYLLYALAVGLERWKLAFRAVVVPAMISLVGISVAFAFNHLTLMVAGMTAIAGQVVSSLVPLTKVEFRARWVPVRSIAATSLRFGLRALVGGVAALANQRLDIVLIAILSSQRQLGYYAVATTIGSLPGYIGTTIMMPLKVIAARGHGLIAARMVALTLFATTVICAIGICLMPFALPLVLGHSYSPSIPMTQLLLVAQIPLAGVAVLTSSLISAGHPAGAGIGEAIALALSVPILVVTLPRYGGMAASLVSILAYTASFVYLILKTRRAFGISMKAMLVPRSVDIVNMMKECRRYGSDALQRGLNSVFLKMSKGARHAK